jgi:hypothetical protein
MLHYLLVYERVGTCSDDHFPNCPILRMAVNLPEVLYECTNLGCFGVKDSALCF